MRTIASADASRSPSRTTWEEADRSAKTALANGDTDSAEDHWREALDIARSFGLPGGNTATTLLHLGRLHLLVAEYSTAKPSLLEASGLCRSRQSDQEIAAVAHEIDVAQEAMAYERTQCREHPSLSSYRCRIADAFVARMPGGPNVLSNLAVPLKHQGETKWAVAILKKAVSLAPRNPAILNNFGNALRQDSQPSEAVLILRQSLEIRPDHPQTLANLGHALRMARKPSEAIPVLTRSLELEPAEPRTMNNLAIAFIENQNTEEARRLFREMQECDEPYDKFYAHLIAGDLWDFDAAWAAATLIEETRRKLLEGLMILTEIGIDGATEALERLKPRMGTEAVKFMRTSALAAFIEHWAASQVDFALPCREIPEKPGSGQ